MGFIKEHQLHLSLLLRCHVAVVMSNTACCDCMLMRQKKKVAEKIYTGANKINATFISVCLLYVSIVQQNKATQICISSLSFACLAPSVNNVQI